MNLLSFLKPAPYKEEIQDPDEVKKGYKYWRFRIFYGMYFGYIFYYFSRKSFTFAMPALMADLGFDKSQIGILGSVLSITYGLSKFLSGVLSDRSNPRYFMAVGLILTGCLNIFFGLSSSILFFVIFWGFNGFFQGWGWPPCARLLTHWYSQKESKAIEAPEKNQKEETARTTPKLNKALMGPLLPLKIRSDAHPAVKLPKHPPISNQETQAPADKIEYPFVSIKNTTFQSVTPVRIT